jgi:Flp pilus assembly pilin Flp
MKKFQKNRKGQGMVEYALLVALIVVIAIAAIATVGRQGNKAFTRVACEITSAIK